MYKPICQKPAQQLLSSLYSTKGQIKPSADWRAVDSLKKKSNKFFFCLFVFHSKDPQICWFVF